MVKKREGYKYVILEPAKTWISEDKCAGCGKPKNEWTRSTRWRCCSPKCTQKFVKNSTYWGWPELRRAAIKRDGKCLKCGVIHTRDVDVGADEEYYHNYEIILETKPYTDEAGYKCEHIKIVDMSKYVVDHIHPIALGGDEWDINNLQTLCIPCNKHKTKRDAGKIARERFKEQLTTAGQKFFGEWDDEI